MFEYHTDLISIAKSIGCRWSKTHQGWYIFNSKENIRLIGNAFQGISKLDDSWLTSNPFKNQKGLVVIEIPAPYLNLLVRRRYSQNTIKTYSYLFKEFINYYSEIEPENISEDQIRAYQDYLVVKKNVSVSTQNQAIGQGLMPLA